MNIARSNVRPREYEMYTHVVSYLTRTDFHDEADPVLAQTAAFVEDTLLNWEFIRSFRVGDTRFAKNNTDKFLHEPQKAMRLFYEAREDSMIEGTPTRIPA